MQIDSHQHYWKLDRGDYGWLTPNAGVLYRDYLPEDLLSELEACKIDKTIVVQAAPTVEETDYLLAMCEHDQTISGIVGWLDLESDHFEEDFKRLKQNPYFVGIRPMLQDLEDDAFILRPNVLAALEVLTAHQFPIDLLVLPKHLPNIVKLLEQAPNLKAVINHLAKPDIKGGVLEPWRSNMRKVSTHSNVYCKVSGMVNEADHKTWKAKDFEPYVHSVIDFFGVDRTMFGSDWPVCRVAAEYPDVYQLMHDTLPQSLNSDDKAKLFGTNAIEFYNLKI